MRINYLKSKGTTKAKKQIIEQEGLYRCGRCMMVFYSNIKYKKHDDCCEDIEQKFEKYQAMLAELNLER